MRIEVLKDYIDIGHEIEFKYRGKMYSITYYSDGRKNYISFCEFYKEPLDVSSVDELLEKEYNGYFIKDILEELDDKQDVWIF